MDVKDDDDQDPYAVKDASVGESECGSEDDDQDLYVPGKRGRRNTGPARWNELDEDEIDDPLSANLREKRRVREMGDEMRTFLDSRQEEYDEEGCTSPEQIFC